MSFNIQPSNRHLAVARVARHDLAAVRRDLLRAAAGIQSDFRTIDTALPAVAQTSFGIYDDSRRLLVAVLLKDLTSGKASAAEPLRETIEILFNPWNDGLGYFQFLVTPQGVTGPYHFTPYEEAHSTAFRHMRPPRVVWDLPGAGQPGETGAAGRQTVAQAWLFAWFDATDVFRFGDVVGFNLARTTGAAPESSTWNPCSGHGMQDATSFGRLHRRPPLHWADRSAVAPAGAGLRLSGRASSRWPKGFYLLDPRGLPVTLKTAWRGLDWSVTVPRLPKKEGRYRLYPVAPDKVLEPRYLAFDRPPAEGTPFAVTMTYDVPDDILDTPVPYTPAALAAELGLMRDHGITRIHWIDYPPETLFNPRWVASSPQAALTQKFCGDLLPLAARLAKARGLEFIGLFKPFDIAFDSTNWSDRDEPPMPGHTVENLEGRNLWLPKAVARHQEATLAVHPDWGPAGEGTLPVRLRLYSREPLPTLKQDDVRLWVSSDNRRYRPYRGLVRAAVRRLRRPCQVWTAAGNRPGPTSESVWVLQLDGLRLSSPYVALEIKAGLRLQGRAHAFAEAWNAQGEPVPVTLATAGGPGRGFSYWQEWKSWANTSPRMLEDVDWGCGFHGFVFDRRRTQPTLLEPCCETAHDIWLAHVRRILRTAADGVGIRTLCHHNNVMDYLSMAFAPSVRARFRAEFGREPTPAWDDAVRIRQLRGWAYTDFIRKASALARNAGKTLALHLEAGIEVPTACDQRMQFNLEWETWIREGLADALVLKWWFSQNPFIHEHVLPLAKRKGIPVHIVDRNCSLNNTPRAIERALSLLRDSRAAGFAGYAWYEAANCKRRNRENVPEFRRHIGEAIRLSARSVCPLQA